MTTATTYYVSLASNFKPGAIQKQYTLEKAVEIVCTNTGLSKDEAFRLFALMEDDKLRIKPVPASRNTCAVDVQVAYCPVADWPFAA